MLWNILFELDVYFFDIYDFNDFFKNRNGIFKYILYI